MYQQSLFGGLVVGRSTSSAAASRARTSARPEEARALKAAGRVYGGRCFGLSASADPLGCSLRMYLLSACEALTGLSLRWRESATPAGHWWLVLGRSGRRTRGTEFGSWPTARAEDSEQTGSQGAALDTLTSAARIFPTPRQADADRGADYGATENHDGGGNLRACVNWPTVHGNNGNNGPSRTELGNAVNKQWPTATAANTRSPAASDATLTRNSRPLQEVVGQHAPANPSTTGRPRGSLNSAWVMQLMGWPQDYAAELTRLFCEYAATGGSIRSSG